MLGDDDCGRFLPCCDFRLDLLRGKIGRDMILRVGGIKLCLVRIDQAADDGPPIRLASQVHMARLVPPVQRVDGAANHAGANECDAGGLPRVGGDPVPIAKAARGAPDRHALGDDVLHDLRRRDDTLGWKLELGGRRERHVTLRPGG